MCFTTTSATIISGSLYRLQIVPRSQAVLDVIFQLDLHDLQIDAVGKWRTEDVVMPF